MLRTPVAVAVACLTGGCTIHDWILERAVHNVAAEMDPQNPVAKTLDASGNPKGEGIVVFSRAEGCAPRFMWVVVTSKPYAVDAASQALTPRLDVLTSATASEQARLGIDAESFGRMMREELCQQAAAQRRADE